MTPAKKIARVETGCTGSETCSACGHPMRKVAWGNQWGFCRCCEARLTDRERATLSFFGLWRKLPWARGLAETEGQWMLMMRELGRVLKSLVDEERSR